MNLTLSARQPFSFLSIVNSHGWVQLAPFGYDKETETLSYIFRLESGRVVELRLRSSASGVRAEVDGTLSAVERSEIRRAVAWMLGLDMDFSEVESRFEKWGKWKGLAYWFWDWSYKG